MIVVVVIIVFGVVVGVVVGVAVVVVVASLAGQNLTGKSGRLIVDILMCTPK